VSDEELWPPGWKETVVKAKTKMAAEPDPVVVPAEVPEVPPSVGRVVHYRSASPDCMAAIITRVLPTIEGQRPGRCELTVFAPITPHPQPVTAEYSPTGEPNCWHWPERV
jgi:hypothetical protein